MKQFKARIITPSRGWHAMEVWLEADNIIDAGKDVMHTLSALGVLPEQVVKLIEIETTP